MSTNEPQLNSSIEQTRARLLEILLFGSSHPQHRPNPIH